ncbi:hypothetical protein [uncultured Parabacteroides sp.]|uniref:hypothetical protein n=1 Tax=uncultured Parabacteroides sp. TaxID=512312 RepID=UPI002615A14C|nr:hypothetical protein [uncultured Parabacteroides sp.]
MKYVEIILKCITALIRVIFPNSPCIPLSRDAGNGGDDSGDRSDTSDNTAKQERNERADWLGISGYTLMIAGGVGCILKHLM